MAASRQFGHLGSCDIAAVMHPRQNACWQGSNAEFSSIEKHIVHLKRLPIVDITLARCGSTWLKLRAGFSGSGRGAPGAAGREEEEEDDEESSSTLPPSFGVEPPA